MRDKRGAVLITTVIILVFLSVLGMSLIAFLFSRFSYSQVQLDRLKALYVAEAGLAQALWELKNDYDPDGTGPKSPGNTIEYVTISGYGEYKTSHNFQTSTITATGKVNEIRRTIQVKYATL